MCKNIFLLLILLMSSVLSFSQSVQEIKQNRVYIWGEGRGTTSSKADKEALNMLISQISTTVESDFKMTNLQKNNKVSTNIEEIVKSYSKATLRNAEMLSWGEEPDVKVIRFIKRVDLNKIFQERKEKIYEFVDFARNAEEKAQLSESLKYYYWALMLINTHPEGTGIKMVINDKEELLSAWISKKINDVFDNIKFTVKDNDIDGTINNLYINLCYNGQKIANCEYSFFDGRNWSTNIEAKDGVGIIEYMGDLSTLKTIRIKIEYIYENEWKIDPEIDDIMQKIEPTIFKKSYKEISLQNNKSNIIPKDKQLFLSQEERVDSSQSKQTLIKIASAKVGNDTIVTLTNVIKEIEKGIHNQNYISIKQYFTDDGFEMFNKLINYGQGKLLTNTIYEYSRFEGGIFCKGMKIRFKFRTNTKAFVEDLSFFFNKEGKIESCAFAMPDQTCKKVLSNNQWGEYSRMAIINLLENFKTAYALKRADYIESIFDDNALIIVGSVIKPYQDKDNMKFHNSKIDLKRTTKQEYIKKLKQVFASNEFVNIKFEDIKFKKAGSGGEIYGIQVRQDYYSSSYGDKGYLFLLVDLNDINKPIIHVRAWQPEKDPNFGFVDVSDF